MKTSESVCGSCWEGANLASSVSKGKLGVFFEGPQGSGKTSVSKLVSNNLGVPISRGFLSGLEISDNNNNQELICKKSYEKVCNTRNESLTIFDRSPISQVAYMMRKENMDYIGCVRKIINQLETNFDDMAFFFLDAASETCLERQKKDTPHALHSINDLVGERVVYKNIFDYLYNLEKMNIKPYFIENNGDKGCEGLCGEIINKIYLCWR